jgi:hypothetical protein
MRGFTSRFKSQLAFLGAISNKVYKENELLQFSESGDTYAVNGKPRRLFGWLESRIAHLFLSSSRGARADEIFVILRLLDNNS